MTTRRELIRRLPGGGKNSLRWRLASVFLGLIILLLLATGFYYRSSGDGARVTQREGDALGRAPSGLLGSPTAVVHAGWKTYHNPTLGFEVDYPPNYRVLIDDPWGKKNPTFISEADDGYAPPGLKIDYDPIHVERDLPRAYATAFMVGDGAETPDYVYIAFQSPLSATIYATCVFYGRREVLTTCNEIISTIRFIPRGVTRAPR